MAKANYISRHILKIIVLALLLAFLLYIAFIWSNTVIRQKLPIQYPEYVEAASEEFGLDKYLVYAIISTESGFDPAAQSSKGAVGLMQLLPETAQWITEKYDLDCDPAALTDPETNIRIGCCYFSYLLSRFEGSTDLAVTAYNGGEGNVRQWLQDSKYSSDGKTLYAIPYKETSKYLSKVTTRYEIYQKLYS
jgi:lytic transglycosylase catalytic